MTLSELSAQRKVPRKYRTAAKSASTRSLSPAKQRASRVVGEDGRDLTAIQKIGQAAEIASLAPVGGGVGLATRGLILGAGRVAPRAVRVGKVASKAAKNPGRASTRAKQAVKKAPGKAKRKVKAKGKKAKRQVKQLKTKKGAARAAKGAAKAPVRVARKNPALATGAYAVAADKTGTNNPVIKTAAADVRGVLNAVDSTSDALETGKTTLRAAPGILTGIGQALGAGGITAGRAALTQASEATGGAVGKKYTAEEIASPVVDTTAEAVRGTKEIVKPFVEGDEAGVKEVVQEQVGFLPIVASPRVISGIRNSKTVNRARQAARENTPRYGSKARQRRSEEQRAENERRKQRDEPKKDKFPTRLGDSRYGGEYLIPVVGRRLERSRERGQTSKDAARGKAVADRQTATVIQSVVPFVRKVKTPAKGKSGNFRRQILDALPTVTAYGIAKDYDTAVEQMARIERGLDRPENPPKASDRRNFAFLRDNPQLFTDENFVAARDRLFDAQDSIVTSEVNRYLPIGASFGIKTPDERLADGVEVQVSVRGGPSQTITVQRDKGRFEPSDIDRKTAKLNNLRNDARAAEKAGDMEKAGQIAAQADALATDLRAWNLAARKAANEFVEETKALVRGRGFETPAYVKDTSNDPEIDQGIDFPASGQLSQRVWVNRDRLRRSGAAERSWDDFVRKSIYGPRAQRVYHSLVTEFVTTRAIPLPSARGTSTYLTRAEINRALSEGLINRKDHAVFHSQHFRAAVQDPYKIDPEKGIGSFYGLDKDGRAQFKELDEEISGSRVAGEIRKRADDPGNKYVVVPRQAVKELEYQFSGPGKLVSRLSNVNRFGSRIVLGYNPSWAVAQLLAEGIPGSVAIGANPFRLRRMRQATKDRKTEPGADRDLFDATAGQTAGTTVLPRQNQGVDVRGVELDTANPVTQGGRTGQFMLDVAKGNALGKFDRWKGGGIRKAVLAAQLDREVNGFLGGLGRYLKLDDQMRTKLKGMSPAQQQTYLLRNPKTARAMESYLDDVMGNWRAITSLEAGPASVTAFYPFVRYSIKSAFWGFPKRHPIKSSILYFFAQLNANELEGLVGEGTPLDWLNYAFPVITVDGDKKVFPDATRIAPALSIVVEAVGTDNFSRIFGGLSPLLGAGYRGLSGDDFTGEPVATSNLDRALLGLAALTSMVAPYRAGSEMLNPDGSTKGLNKLTLRGYTPRREYGEGGRTSVIGGRSETSKALGDLDTDRGLGALLFPFQAQDAKDFAKTREIIAALNEGRFGDLPGSAASGGGSSSSKDLSFREAMLGGGSSSSSSAKRKQSFREAMLGP